MSSVASRRCYFLLAALVLSACNANSTPTPTVPVIDAVHVSPFALPLARSVAEPYLEQHGPLPFDLIPMGSPDAVEAVAAGEAALHIDYPPIPESWFATPLGWEGIAIIVHPDVPIRSLSLAELADIYAGRVVDWQAFGRGQGPIQPIIPPGGDTMRSMFEEIVLPEGRVTTLARLSPTPAEALQLVATTEGSIGLIPAHYDLEAEPVSLLRVEEQLPSPEAIDTGDYPLRSQVVAMAPAEPSGAIRSWLAWAQQRSAQEQHP